MTGFSKMCVLAGLSIVLVAAGIVAGVAACLASAPATGGAEPKGALAAPKGAPVGSPQDRSVSLTYRFKVRDLPGGSAQAQIWIPLPDENAHQKVHSVELAGGYKSTTVRDAEYGNRFLRLDLPSARLAAAAETGITLDFSVTRNAYRVAPGTPPLDKASKAVLDRFLSPDHLVPIDGKISQEARKVAGDATTPIERARRLYDHVVATMRYEKTGTDWGRGDALWACDSRKGNCTDFHSLFIGEARALNMPARFIMGVPLPDDRKEGAIGGYHCWAEFYVDGTGWVPIDASEAFKHPEKKEMLFAGLDANRVQFTTGRDIRLPGAAGGPLNYAIYPYIEIDGKPHVKIETELSFKELTRG